jgi:hypothetical protein
MLLEKWDYGRRAPWVTNRELQTGRTAVVKIQENGIKGGDMARRFVWNGLQAVELK